MQFECSALNNENKKLTGFINAANEDAARLELNNLGLSLLGISTAPEKKNSDEKKLKFEALDRNGKKIIGTIPEIDYKKAFGRLTEEYGFQILALYPISASEEEKERSKTLIAQLKTEYEIEKSNTEAPDVLTPEEKKNKGVLLTELEFVLKKVDQVLEKFGDNIKPEERTHMGQIRDKLLRLKNSNNLNFIKQTCEELLETIQNKEIYLNQDKFVQERERIKLETQKLLMEVHRIDTNPAHSVIEQDNMIRTHKFSLFKKGILDPHVADLEEKRTALGKEWFDYVRIWFKSDRTIKPEVAQKCRLLWEERKAVGTQLAMLRHTKKQERKTAQVSGEVDADLAMLTGWLLCAYLLYYFISYYLTFKTHILSEQINPAGTNIYASPVLSYFIISVFLLHIIVQTKRFFVPIAHSAIFNSIAYPLFFICIILININF